jgi:hypothetical protein
MKSKKMYQNDGVISVNIKPSSDLSEMLMRLSSGNTPKGYYWQDKSEFNRQDIMPNSYSVDESVFNFLAENNIKSLIEQLLGDNYTLVNVGIVKSLPPGYMSGWHSDNYDKPIHKLIFYPSFNETGHPRFQYLKGRIKGNSRLKYNKVIAKIEPMIFRKYMNTVYSSDYEAAFVNTQIMHRAMPTSEEKGAIRILYSFRERFDNDTEISEYLASAKGTVDEIKHIMAIWEGL